MSVPPSKRSHEEGGNGGGSFNHMSISKYSHADSAAPPVAGSKLTASGPAEYNTPHEVSQESRMLKIPRTESRDPDRKSPLVPMFRTSSSSNDVRSDRPAGTETRVDFRDSWNNNRDIKGETKIESRDLHQMTKVEKDMKFDGKTEDNKETNPEKNIYHERKEGSGLVSSQLNRKDSKEQHRGKSYPDDTGGNVDSRHSSRAIPHGPADAGKQCPNTEEKEHHEFHEVAGRNIIDLKGDDKVKDKEMKRKEGKHRDSGEVDKERSDRQNTLPLGGSSSERDVLKEERDAERWNRERKDMVKDKEKPKEREKEFIKREAWSGAEKEGPHNSKERMDISGSHAEQDDVVSEQKKQNENIKDRKEGDEEANTDRADTLNRSDAKESDDGMDAEGGTAGEKEGIQHRKKMLHPRASPRANRDPHKSHSQDNEGPQVRPVGMSGVSTVVYRVGECMEEIIKLWKEFKSSQADRVSGSSETGPTLEICIPAEHVCATNRQVRGGQLWGTDIYTNDSDLVAVLMHTGYLKLTASPPLPIIKELRATIRVMLPLDCYIATLRNNVRSRAWGAGILCSYRVEKCVILKEDGGTVDLKPSLAQSSTLEPTLAPVAAERTMTTRAAASNALRQQRFVREVTIQFNLSNEPWLNKVDNLLEPEVVHLSKHEMIGLKYSISVVADKGLKKPLFTSSRLKKGEVLYLESHSNRYELCFHEEKMVKPSQAVEAECDKSQKLISNPSSSELKGVDGENGAMYTDVFRWSRCKKFFTEKRTRSVGIPLPLEHVEVLEENLEWDDIQWSQTGVVIAGKQYNLARAHFLSPKN